MKYNLVSEYRLAEIKVAVTDNFASIGIDLDLGSTQVTALARECLRYHGKLSKELFTNLFYYYAMSFLPGMEYEKAEPTSYFITKMKRAYFKAPGEPVKREKAWREKEDGFVASLKQNPDYLKATRHYEQTGELHIINS